MPAPAPHPARNLWPAGIVAAFVLFVAGTVALILLSTLGHDDLVAADYYAQELRYQQRIDRQARTQSVAAQVSVHYDAATATLVVTLPPGHAAPRTSGEIHLYRPSAAGEDRRVPLALDALGRQVLGARELAAGLWRVRIAWSAGGQEFFTDQKVVLPRAAAD